MRRTAARTPLVGRPKGREAIEGRAGLDPAAAVLKFSCPERDSNPHVLADKGF